MMEAATRDQGLYITGYVFFSLLKLQFINGDNSTRKCLKIYKTTNQPRAL